MYSLFHFGDVNEFGLTYAYGFRFESFNSALCIFICLKVYVQLQLNQYNIMFTQYHHNVSVSWNGSVFLT